MKNTNNKLKDKTRITRLLLELVDAFGDRVVERYPDWKPIDSKRIRDIKSELIELSFPFALSAWTKRLPTSNPDESLLNLAILQAIDLYVYKQQKFQRCYEFSPFVWSEVRGLINKDIGKKTRYSKALSVSRDENYYDSISTLEYSREELLKYLDSKVISKQLYTKLLELIDKKPYSRLNKVLNSKKTKQLITQLNLAPRKIVPDFALVRKTSGDVLTEGI